MYAYLCILFLITVNSGAFVYKDYKAYKRYNGDFINCEIKKKMDDIDIFCPEIFIMARRLSENTNSQKTYSY